MQFFSTDDVHPRDKKEYWRSVASSVFLELNCVPRDKNRFEADMSSVELADLKLITINTGECTVFRNDAIIKRAQSDDFMLSIQLTGAVCLQQGRASAYLQPGDCCLYDGSRPYRIDVPQKGSQLVVKMGRHHLERRLGRLERFTGRLLRGDDAVSSIMAGFWRLLPERAESVDRHFASRLAVQALDLLASALEEGPSGDRQSSTCRALTVMRIKDIIELRLSKPDLSCAGIAAEAGISRRYLSRLFEAEDISVEAYIKRRGLEMCREAFQSKQQASRSIGEISFGWGFKDAAHFSRSFKAYYNESPRNYRSSQPCSAG